MGEQFVMGEHVPAKESDERSWEQSVRPAMAKSRSQCLDDDYGDSRMVSLSLSSATAKCSSGNGREPTPTPE